MSNELVERVARALFLEDERQHDGAPGTAYADYIFGLAEDAFGEDGDLRHHADGYRESARAALQAMREPTKPMMSAGDEWVNHHADCVYTIWQAMLDAALVEA